MTVKIDGTNTEANPAFTGADTDTGLQCGTNEVKLVTGGTARATVNSSGRLLVNTSTARNNFYYSSTGRTPGIQYEGSGSDTALSVLRTDGLAAIYLANASTTIGSSSTIGGLNFVGNDGTNLRSFAKIEASSDGGVSTGDVPGRLVFSTTANTESSPTERMRIDSSGQFLLYSEGTSSRTSVTNSGTSSGSSAFDIKNGATSVTTGTQVFSIRENGDIYTSGNTTVQALSSERRLKENIEVIDPATAWTTIKNTPYYSYNYIGQEGPRYGPIVDEVPADMVRDTDLSDDQGPIRTFDNGMLHARLYSALQQAIAKIETLETKVAALEAAE